MRGHIVTEGEAIKRIVGALETLAQEAREIRCVLECIDYGLEQQRGITETETWKALGKWMTGEGFDVNGN
jgi:hypothetical protein